MQKVVISVIIPILNGSKLVGETLEALACQTVLQNKDVGLEVIVYDDASSDNSVQVVECYRSFLESHGICLVVGKSPRSTPGGCGFAKNRAVELSSGKYVCFNDADDISLPRRLERQLEVAFHLPSCIVGSCFVRSPATSTARYTQWLNSMTSDQLFTSRYRECTLAMPTWFCDKRVFERVGGFAETKGDCFSSFESAGALQLDNLKTSVAKHSPRAVAEDLLFLYRHLTSGGGLHRVDECLLVYRYHPLCATFSVPWQEIWNIRIRAIEANVLEYWERFGIWNAGKEGKRFFRSLKPQNRAKVEAFYDVDEHKIKQVQVYVDNLCPEKRRIPIKHWSSAVPKFITCVKYMITGGKFEMFLAQLQLNEGVDYFHFS